MHEYFLRRKLKPDNIDSSFKNHFGGKPDVILDEEDEATLESKDA